MSLNEQSLLDKSALKPLKMSHSVWKSSKMSHSSFLNHKRINNIFVSNDVSVHKMSSSKTIFSINITMRLFEWFSYNMSQGKNLFAFNGGNSRSWWIMLSKDFNSVWYYGWRPVLTKVASSSAEAFRGGRMSGHEGRNAFTGKWPS